MCSEQWCPECGDKMIHLTNRGPHESSSAFGQFIHDMGESLRGVWLQMFWTDIDGVIFKKKTSILRVIEHKPHLDTMSEGQKVVLPLLAKSIQLLSATGLLHAQSGVFVINADPPYDEILVTQQKGWQSVSVWRPVKLVGELRDRFLQGEVVELDEPARASKVAA